jgi:hypothetical protein
LHFSDHKTDNEREILCVALDSTAFLANIKGFFFIASGAEMTFTIMSQVVIFQDTVTTVPFFLANGTLVLVGSHIRNNRSRRNKDETFERPSSYVRRVVKRLPWR